MCISESSTIPGVARVILFPLVTRRRALMFLSRNLWFFLYIILYSTNSWSHLIICMHSLPSHCPYNLSYSPVSPPDCMLGFCGAGTKWSRPTGHALQHAIRGHPWSGCNNRLSLSVNRNHHVQLSVRILAFLRPFCILCNSHWLTRK